MIEYETPELLRKIASRIEEVGWYKARSASLGRECVMLAAANICGGHTDEETTALARKIRLALDISDDFMHRYHAQGVGAEYGSMTAWNDSQPDAETLCRALRTAANRLQEVTCHIVS